MAYNCQNIENGSKNLPWQFMQSNIHDSDTSLQKVFYHDGSRAHAIITSTDILKIEIQPTDPCARDDQVGW